MKIEEYLRRKNAKKQGLFNDEIDFGSDYYEDFDIEDAEDRDNLNSYDYSDFIANNGWINSKTNGKMRLEGKDYIVNDGDVLNFRFNT